MKPATRAELAALAVLGGAALLVSWPWLAGDAAFAQRDAAFTMVGLQQLQRIVGGELPWDAAALGWPVHPGLVQTDWMLGQALLGMPLRLAGLGMARAYGWLVLAGLFATAWTGHRLAQALTGSGPHTWMAGVAAGIGPLQLAHCPHVNLVHHELVLGGALLLAQGLTSGRTRRAALGAALLAASFHFGIYIGLHAALAGVAVLLGAIVSRRARGPALLAALLAGGAVLVTVAPVLMAYASYTTHQGVRLGPLELAGESWDLADTLRPLSGAWLHGLLPASWTRHGGQDPPNFGYVLGLLAVMGLLPAWRRGWAWRTVMGLGLAAALLALGPAPAWRHLPLGGPGPLAFLYDLAGHPNLRAPARWLWLTSVSAGLLASLSLARLGRRLGPWPTAVAGVLAVAVVVGEAPRAATFPRRSLRAPPAYRALQELPPGPLYEHFQGPPEPGRDMATVALRAALRHQRPLVGGHWARATPALTALNALAGSWPSAEAVELLRALGVVAVLQHPPLRGLPPSEAHCESSGVLRLCALTPLFPEGLPAVDAVTTDGAGPALGLRIAAPAGPEMELRCPGQPPWRTHTAVWKTIAALRGGPGTTRLDVFLPQPCASTPSVDTGTAVPLFSRGLQGTAP